MHAVPVPNFPPVPAGESSSLWPVFLGLALWLGLVVVHAILAVRKDPR